MKRFLYVLTTLVIGLFLHFFCGRYLSLFEASPQILLLLVLSHGFMMGPAMGELLGFFWGLLSDAMGVHMFGMNTLLLSLAGYLAGTLRRRVASERPTAQLVIAVAATLFYDAFASLLFSIFEGIRGRSTVSGVALRIFFNLLFATGVFNVTERWIELWRIDHDHN